ncbi:MAG TPA: glycoside hydrolase family 2 TIM barrel-domain containing protein [Paenibacillus sp.]
MNHKRLFNEGWEFAKSTLEEMDDKSLDFKPVDLPHDWLIYNTLDLYENSIGWYRKSFIHAKNDKQLLLCFDGIYMDSAIYVNNQWVGEWKYGYSSFEYEITDKLIDGENEILVKVVHQSPNSRWYSGAGIYRNVWLKTRDCNHIVTDGVYIHTVQMDDEWRVEIDTDVNITENMRLAQTILHKDQVIKTYVEGISAEAQSQAPLRVSQMLSVEDPLLWSTHEPHLYQLKTELQYMENNHDSGEGWITIEEVTQCIGFRRIVLDPQEGMLLNGQKIKLNGVCEHHDLGALGAAFHTAALRRRFEILKDMGVNAIRTAHNMPAAELMDLADEMGLLVVSEAFDMWERSKTPYDYARFFKDWALRDVRNWVMRDRNHPSLFLWSIGNEIYDTHADHRGQEITSMLMEAVLQYDPSGNGKVTIGSNYMPWENAQKCADIVKLAGYNYAEKYYHQHHAEHPDWIIYGSETASIVQSRGIYHFPFEQSILADDDEQCSALGNSATSWGAKSAEACIIAERDAAFSLGQFIWTGFDYIGEPTPYHTKNSYFGQIDTATFKKDSYYMYQSAWTNYKKHPMVHIFPYWDFNPGQMIDVRVCSNAPKIELQLNGETVGTYDIDHEHGTQLAGWWKIPYKPGELKAIAYDEAGQIIAVDIRQSFGDASQICLKADKDTLLANGTDLIFVEITMEDESGHPVENANNRVQVMVSGAGRLIGLDNGDSTDFDAYKGISRRLFSGKLMAIVAAEVEAGMITVEVTSNGVAGSKLQLQSLSVIDSSIGVSANTRNFELPCVMGNAEEIPLRKIEIISHSGQHFNENRREMIVHANLYPVDTSYTEVEWSIVNDGGIESNLAWIEQWGPEAKITALGDGHFRVRCMSKNGTEKTKLISQLEFTASGLGTAFKDPYGFISGGLYDEVKGEVGNGNERGVATSRDGETQVVYREIDFGPYGSDLISIPIFTLTSEAYNLQIWEGMPDEEDSELLADVIYQKETKWNVYQEATYLLSKRLTGITSICFVLQKKVHIKGFSFMKKNPAFEQNRAADCNRIYGDTFNFAEQGIEGIGNNVSLVFEQMDFTIEGTSKFVICGRSPIDKNTIHIRFEEGAESSNQLIEFTQSDEYVERAFKLEKVTGEQKVTFIFLPGSQFDFSWFRFE